MASFIEKDRWKSFLDDFTKRNQFRATRLEVIGEEVGAQSEEDFLPLVGVSLESKGTEAGSVVVVLGGETSKDRRHVERHVENVQRITPLMDETSGLEEGLGLEDADGAKTLLILEQMAEIPAQTSSGERARTHA